MSGVEDMVATAYIAADSDIGYPASNVPEAQLVLYQTVPLHIDNLFPYTRALPVHAVPSPNNPTGTSENKSRLGHHDQLAAHLEGNIKSSLYTLTSQPDTCIQWRLLADRKTLELRPLHWVASTDASQEQTKQQYFDAQAIEEAGGEVSACVTSTWCFESPLLDSVVIAEHISSEERVSISITLCSQDGVIYRLGFASVWEISSDSINVNSCTSWYQIEWCHDAGNQIVSGRMPVLFDGLDARTLAAGCEDSALVWLQWQHIPDEVCGSLQGYVVERVTSSSGILRSVKGLIPRILRRGGSTMSEEESSSGRPISFAITQVLDSSVQYAVTLSRDRKLRFWSSNQASSCQHEEQLPQLDILGCPIPANPHDSSSPLLDSSVHRYIRVVSHDLEAWPGGSGIESNKSNVFGVLVFVPDEATPYFTLLQVSIDSQGRINNVQTVMYKVCKATSGASRLMSDDELVDFQLSRHEELVPTLVEGPNGQPVDEEVLGSYWALWALWERSQESVLTYTYFSLRSDTSSSADDPQLQFDGHPILGERWYSTLAQQQGLKPTNDGPQIKEIEAQLARSTNIQHGTNDKTNEDSGGSNSDAQNDPDAHNTNELAVQVADISKAFLDHLFHPTRFDRGVLEHALSLYEASARDRGYDFPATQYQATSSSPHLRQRVATVVGSFLRAETSRRNGTILVDEYYRALFTEWMRYSTLCARMQRIANTPRSLALCQSTGMVSIVSGNSISTLQTASEIEWMHALSQRDPAASILLSAPEHSIAKKYPDLSQGNARAELARLISAASYLREAMPLDRLSALNDEMMQEASGEILVSFESRAAELFEKYAVNSIKVRHVKHAAKLLGLCRAPGDTIRNLLQALVESTDITSPLTLADDPQSFKSSASMDGLFTSAFAMSTNARFELARDIGFMLICISYYCEEMGCVDIGNILLLLSHSFGIFSLFAIAQWVASQSISESSDGALVDDSTAADGFLRKFSVLNINKRRDSAGSIVSKPSAEQIALKPNKKGPAFVYSIMHNVINSSYSLRFAGRSGLFADMVAEGVAQIYANVGFSAGWAGHPSLVLGSAAQTNFLLFAAHMEKTAPAEMAEAFLQFLPKSTAACYLNGLIALRMRDYSAAGDFFANAGIAYAQVFEGIRESVDLQYVLPRPVLESGLAYTYHEHIADLFEAARSFAGVSRFSHLALESLQEEAELEGSGITAALAKERRQKLWFKIFHAELELNAYEKAYIAVMANPDQKLQQDCLRHLVGVLCEREGGVAILCRLSFAGLQEDVERSLLFKARHSDILAKPNYYKILYSFHVYRGNYRNAASAMYQYARRLSVHMLYGGDVSRLLVEQGQALLGCINGLSLVDKQYAWVVVGRQQGAGDGLDSTGFGASDGNTKRKRRRIAIGRYDTTSSGQSQDIDIIEIADVQREYMLCMARITLGATFQELFSCNVLLEPEDAVALYVKTGMYDNAMSFAKEFELKLDYVFLALVQKCLELSAVNSAETQREQTPEAFWENRGLQSVVGTPSERAWRLLQHYLDREEPNEKLDQHYRLLVADAVLRAECDAELAPWLTSRLLRQCPQDLVRLCMRNGCVTEGAGFLLQHINSLCIKISSPEAVSSLFKKTREFWLPYQLIDQTMGIMDDAIVRFEEAVGKIKQAKKQGGSDSEATRLKSLHKSYRERLSGLQRLRGDLQSAFDRYMEFAARESCDISEQCDS
ncbi:nucleoporin Nup120/160-domain-containing protein [Coemansia spiralis]|nr:nucleoporin Nup120/160-domain-containing protein [Coemansia spiralis]